MANNEKVIKGTEEKAAAKRLRAFMKKHEQSAPFIAGEIQKAEDNKFSPKTIYNWLDDKNTMSFKNWDFIVSHIERYEKA